MDTDAVAILTAWILIILFAASMLYALGYVTGRAVGGTLTPTPHRNVKIDEDYTLDPKMFEDAMQGETVVITSGTVEGMPFTNVLGVGCVAGLLKDSVHETFSDS